ncbi:FAD-binding oxidoreductase [Nocardioides sp. L-11A]|uniref:FAD-binding oxidoreductase n=1 Tax=Nocardioides sp. L-11A TaxID=3043848 RepID=UPI00249BC902|nr:FAD-linked oxidase C-terminal domain-containing protein [Nocardioides sp. L-11A]
MSVDNHVAGRAPDLSVLVDSLGQGQVIVDPDRMAGYRWDRANDLGAGVPLVVVRAESTDDVQVAVRFAALHGIAVVPRGAGSGLSGGASAVDGCMVISTERMRELEIDPRTSTATVGPGLLNAEVKAAAAEHRLWYPPDPASFEFCSIGGNVATNAGGLCCVKYGVTADYVLGLTVVLADGIAVDLGGPRLKDVAGLSLTQLFVGSEGTLGIITRIVLRLVPAQRSPSTVVATFHSLDAATAAVLDIKRAMRPSMLELMDRTSINAVEDVARMGLDRAAAAMLVIQSDEPGAHAAEEIARIEEICTGHAADEVYATDDPETGEMFVAARRMAVPAIEKLGSLLLEDVGVPVPRLGELVRGIERIRREREVLVAVIAHAGDGNAHPLIVFDPTDADEAARAQLAYGDIMDLALALGGTITGEHGVGRLKRPWLGAYLGPEALALNRRVKSALDPAGILNPGALL